MSTNETIDFNATPGMMPPKNHRPEFDAPWNSLQIGTCIAFGVTIFLATIFLSLRFLSAFKLVQKLEIDLIIITASYGISIFYFATLVELMRHGWGKHLYDVSLADLMIFNSNLLPNTLAYLICPGVTKLAMLTVLYRINPSYLYRASVIVIAISIVAYTLTLCILTGGPCNPNLENSLTCLQNVALSHAILNIVSDFAVIIMPLPTIYGLNMDKRQKVSVGLLLAVGSAVVICSIARLPYVVVLPSTEDATYTQAILGIWCTVEINIGIMCACAMRLKSFVKAYLPALGFFSAGTRSGSRSWPWVKNSGTKKSYQLHSVQKASGHPTSINEEIHVSRSYDVSRVQQAADGLGSTDSIITTRR